jgi:O-antigen ligase
VACAAPLCLAVALIDQRQLRTAAAIAVGLCVPAAYGTDVRAALPALIAGGGTVIILNQLSSGARALRQTVVAVAIAVVGGTILFSTVTGSNSGRYGAILSPGGDPSYQAHLRKWEEAVSDIGGHPFGLGLGTAGRIAETGENGVLTIASYNLDNSYLKIAYEQGFIVLALFVAAMIALLVGLARRAVRARSPGVRAMATGAAGSLVAASVMFFTGIYVEDLIAFALWIPVGAAIGAIAAESARPAD